jgi:mRNA-degrading endonuclease RelE of RelBE toxin-antitoxin system
MRMRMSSKAPLNFEILPAVKSFFKSIKKDKPLLQKFEKAIKELQLDPSLGDQKKGDLSGVFSLDIKHNRTNYELAYGIEEKEDGELLLIILAGTRENFYDDLKKYIKSSGAKKRILGK